MNKDIKEKSYIKDFRSLFSYKDYRLTKSIENDNSIDFIFVRRKSYAACPLCGNKSRKKHSTQLRHILDLPILDKQVHLIFNCDRYYCVSPSCKRKIFVSSIEGFRSRARRTPRLAANLRQRVSVVTYNPDIVRVELWRHIFSFCRKDIQRKYERYIIYNEMAVKGYSIKEIAEKLKMNVANVHRHRNM